MSPKGGREFNRSFGTASDPRKAYAYFLIANALGTRATTLPAFARRGPQAFTYITPFTASTTRLMFGSDSSIRFAANGRGVSAWVTRTTGASR